MQNQTHANTTLNAIATEHSAPVLAGTTPFSPVELKLEELALISGGNGGSTDAPKTTW